MATSFNHEVGVYTDQSAMEMVPVLMELFNPKSVVDVGCGIGNFLKIFSKYGVSNFLGLDGDWVDPKLLIENIPAEKFKKIDLETEFVSFVKVQKQKYDLLISLEVAEHLKEQSAASFISGLCALSDQIIFSAAIPLQGGENHINEQWPVYWISLFKENGFVCQDIIRPVIWDNKKIHWWYRQNTFCFKRITNAQEQPVGHIYNLVHPDFYLNRSQWINNMNNGKFSFGYYLLLLKKMISGKFK